MYIRKIVFWAACLGMLLFGLGLITLGSLAPDLKIKFSLDDLSAGTLFSILPIGILVGSLVFGPICDRYGYKAILISSCLGMCIGFEGIAWSSSYQPLKVFILIFGLSAGIINGATNAVVSDISEESKGANLSLLGVFFGVGALGMPFILGLLKHSFTSFEIVAAIGFLTVAVAIFYMLTTFPPSKKELGFALSNPGHLFKQRYLYLLAFYLFFQGGVETITNNWTTLYLTNHLQVTQTNALYALSLFVLGMTVMRLLLGTAFKSVAFIRLMISSLCLVLIGTLLVRFGQGYAWSVAGLVMIGIGLAAGFPIIMGLAGDRFRAQTATVFSIIFTIVLAGNMLFNYLMGVIANKSGIQHYTTITLIDLVFMFIFAILINRAQPKERIAAEPPLGKLTTIQEVTIK
jgi:MFS transporter, FHS family, glucose/mannose:H+ symporter